MTDTNGPLNTLRAVPILPVDDVTSAAGWFEEILGWKTTFLWAEPESGKPPFYGGVQHGEAQIHLNSADNEAGRPAKVYVMLEGVDSLADAICTRGGTLAQEPQTYPYGMRDFTIHDPSGNRITFGQSVEEN